MSHPDSDNLRQLATWLDEHGQHLPSVGAFAWMADSAGPTELAQVVAAAGGPVNYRSMDCRYPCVKLSSLELTVHFDRERCLERRTVTREVEEFVLGDAA